VTGLAVTTSKQTSHDPRTASRRSLIGYKPAIGNKSFGETRTTKLERLLEDGRGVIERIDQQFLCCHGVGTKVSRGNVIYVKSRQLCKLFATNSTDSLCSNR